MQKKWIVGIIIVVIILGMIFINWRLSGSINTIKQDCLTATEPQLKVPIQVFEGTVFTVQVCGINPNHIYQIRENNDNTSILSFTGVNHSFIPLSSTGFLDDGTLKIVLFDNTTQTIIDEKMIVLISNCGFCDTTIMLDLAIPLLIIFVIITAVLGITRRIKK